ncbi:hypothetical protein BHE90_004952 [Fusarium euwallaceae]|uniref:nitric oxide dioxygenase n=3 Tax=Fusarium solani species complex TaxID=232080 RepID=A0A430LXX0_9HYPO|nr:hypothetical protein BHE90_004952 [Fusarium euwallaceae]
MALSYQEAKLIQDTIPALTDHGERITTILYRRMLRDHPELNDHFNLANMASGRMPRALMAVILNYASNINNITELIPKLERMSHKHCSLGVMPENYSIVAKYLINAFAEALGPAMTPSVIDAWTKVYWMLARMLAGRESQLYRSFGRWQGYRQFRIEKKVEEAQNVYSIYLVPVDGQPLPTFMPGQYVSVRVDLPAKGHHQSRQYSLSDAPQQDYYRITIKRAGIKDHEFRNLGVVSNILIDEKGNGDIVQLTHPAGDFFLDMDNPSNGPIVLISAGIGLAPMISILNAISQRSPSRPISWIYGSHRDIPFHEHVRRTERSHPNLRVNMFQTQPAGPGQVCTIHRGRLNLAKVRSADLWLGNRSAEYYVCGPEKFMMEVSRYLRARSVDSGRLKFELFCVGDSEFKVDPLDLIRAESRAFCKET